MCWTSTRPCDDGCRGRPAPRRLDAWGLGRLRRPGETLRGAGELEVCQLELASEVGRVADAEVRVAVVEQDVGLAGLAETSPMRGTHSANSCSP